MGSSQQQGAYASSLSNAPISTTSIIIESGSETNEGIMEVIRPAMSKLDEQVKSTKKSQLMLVNYIDTLASHLKKINGEIESEQTMPSTLNEYVRKLDDSRQRIKALSTRLQAIHERMSQLQRSIARENFKQKQMLKSPK